MVSNSFCEDSQVNPDTVTIAFVKASELVVKGRKITLCLNLLQHGREIRNAK